MHADRCGDTPRQKYRAKGSGKEANYGSSCMEIQGMWNLKCKILALTL